MEQIYEGIELDAQQTEWICRGLMDLARVDGVHESELELIRQFYTTSGGSEAALDALLAQPFELSTCVAALSTGGLPVVESFILSCYLLIYADGEHSDEERARVSAYAKAFGLDEAALEALHLKARLYLLKVLATQLRNRDAVRYVGASMGLSNDDIKSLMEG